MEFLSLYPFPKRKEPGRGYIHFTDWLGHWFYRELTKEVRTGRGWEIQGAKGGNEACYARAAAIVKRAESIDGDNPSGWARPWRENTE